MQNAAHRVLRHPQPLEPGQHILDAPTAVLRVLLLHPRHCLPGPTVRRLRSTFPLACRLGVQPLHSLLQVAAHPVPHRRVAQLERLCHVHHVQLVLHDSLHHPLA